MKYKYITLNIYTYLIMLKKVTMNVKNHLSLNLLSLSYVHIPIPIGIDFSNFQFCS